ncbi:MAG: hypothetical protein NTW86_04545 [Candidatus Sumerlaeota bacterium]|nr:hypothetical protein [Candidatus Sumerlaeota bacterium]
MSIPPWPIAWKRVWPPVAILAVFLWPPFSLAAAPREASADQLQQMLRRFPDADLNKASRLTLDEFRQHRLGTRPGGAAASSRSSAKAKNAPPAKAANAAAAAEASQPSAPAASAPAAGPVAVRIASDKPVPVNPRVYGINCEEMFMKDLVDEPEYIAALTDLKFKSFLFPGGSITYYHHPRGTGGFNIRPEEVAKSKQGGQSRFMNQNAGPDHFAQYIQFVKASGAGSIFVANILNGTVDELDEYLTRLKAADVPIECVVLGVEMHLGQPRELGLDGYIERIKPYIAMLQAKHPGIPIVAHGTPVGWRENAPASSHERNQKLARLPGIDGFSQYAFAPFGCQPGTKSLAVGPDALPPAERWRRYDEFIRDFGAQQIPVYQQEWGADKKMHIAQWGTQAEQNTAVQGLHVANFFFFLAQYNAAHNDYIAAATSALLLAQNSSKGGRMIGPVYKDKIALLTPYLYTKPFRHLFSGDTGLLAAPVEGGGAAGAVKALAAASPDGRKYLYLINSGPAAPLGEVTIDGRELSADLRVQVESVYVSGAANAGLARGGSAPAKTFTGERGLNGLVLEPFSLTLLIMPKGY